MENEKIEIEKHKKITSKYQLTKTIRFKLKPITNNGELQNDVIKIENANFDKLLESLDDLKTLLKKFSNELNDTLYTQTNRFHSGLTIKYRWLQLYTKQSFYDWRSNPNEKRYSLAEIDYLEEVLEQWFENWNKLTKELITVCDTYKNIKEARNRKSQIAYLVNTLNSRDYLPFIYEFINYLNSKNKTLNELLNLNEKVKVWFENLSKSLLPAQSNGYRIAKASLNYYTINKKPKDLDDQLIEIKEKLSNSFDTKLILNEKILDYNQITKLLLEKNKEINSVKFCDQSIDKQYSILKEDKAEQKKIFQESISQGENFEDIKRNTPLFSDVKNYFDNFKKLSNQIVELGNKVNQKDKSKSDKEKIQRQIKEKKSKRGKFYQIYFKQYMKYCEFYKELAMQYGKLKAKKKAIEKDINEAKLTRYWSIIIEKHNYYELALIPNEKVKLAKEFIENQSTSSGKFSFYHFESLTLRALNKLCFKSPEDLNNSFYEGIKKEFNESEIKEGTHEFKKIDKLALLEYFQNCLKQKNINNILGVEFDNVINIKFKSLISFEEKLASLNLSNRQGEVINREYLDHNLFKNNKSYLSSQLQNLKDSISYFNTLVDEKALVNYYQEVLKTNYAQKNLDLPINSQSDILDKIYNSVDDFRSDLEKQCYTVKQKMSSQSYDEFISTYKAEVFELTSLNLNAIKNNYQNKSNLKNHTNLWVNFWKNSNKENYDIRLNPELSITWREPRQSRITKYGKDSNNYNPNMNNRYLHEQYTLMTTITENATGKMSDLSFKGTSEIEAHIREFNSNLNLGNAKYSFGIDRGDAELASLCIINNNSSYNDKHYEVYEAPKFNYYKLNNLAHTKKVVLKNEDVVIKKAIDNLSYFLDELDNENIFEKISSSSIDLTKAKLFKNNIIINGDIRTYLRLKLENAKFNILKLYKNGFLDSKRAKIAFNQKNKSFYIMTNKVHKKNETIYFLRDELDKIASQNQIQEELEAILKFTLNKKQDSELLTLNKVNNLRDALSANMIGIISHLHDKFSNSIITIEDLNKENIAKNSHNKDQYENISRRFEWALYKKFKNKLLVPPFLKESIKIRELGVKQIGNIVFIPKDHTSTQCPYCGIKNKSDENKFENHKYTCSICGFDTQANKKGLDYIDSPDTLAAYNIAKLGFEYLKNPSEYEIKTTKINSKNQNNSSKLDQNQTKKLSKPKKTPKIKMSSDIKKAKKLLR